MLGQQHHGFVGVWVTWECCKFVITCQNWVGTGPMVATSVRFQLCSDLYGRFVIPFRITDLLWGESHGRRWIPLTRARIKRVKEQARSGLPVWCNWPAGINDSSHGWWTICARSFSQNTSVSQDQCAFVQSAHKVRVPLKAPFSRVPADGWERQMTYRFYCHLPPKLAWRIKTQETLMWSGQRRWCEKIRRKSGRSAAGNAYWVGKVLHLAFIYGSFMISSRSRDRFLKQTRYIHKTILLWNGPLAYQVGSNLWPSST